MTAYYNEIEPYAADWLENLIAAGHIAPGVVDRRDIRDIRPSELAGFTQCHFFAGIGVWSAALRGAGWDDGRPVWTGSCPCQPFSAAGAGAGFADERHLWPHWNHLITECRPPVVFGEQVASKNVDPWVDLVHADLEALGYAFGCVPFPAAGIGAPHIRDRTYWVAHGHCELHDGCRDVGTRWWSEDSDRHSACRLDHHHHQGPQGHAGDGDCGGGWSGAARSASEAGVSGWLPDADRGECNGIAACEGREPNRSTAGREQSDGCTADDCCSGWLPDSESGGRGEECPHGGGSGPGDRAEGRSAGHSSSSSIGRLVDADQPGASPEREQRGGELGRLGGDQGTGAARNTRRIERPSPTNGFWRDVDWLLCRDGKWRPVRPSAQQMVDGSTASLGPVRSEIIDAVQLAVAAWAKRHQTDGTQGVRDLWDSLSQEEVEQRTDGRFDSVREAPFLLALLRQLSNQGWCFPIGDERASSEASRTVLRVLRYDAEPRYSSRGRGLDEQPFGEPADPLRQLSQVLAHYAEDAWGLSGWKDVGSFPLAIGAESRVGRLRAYGNAIVREAAQTFIETFLEHEREGGAALVGDSSLIEADCFEGLLG